LAGQPRTAVREFERAIDAARKGRRTDAASYLEEAIRLSPEFFAAHINLGVLYQKLERYRDAEREYREAHRLNPRSAAPLVNLGSLHIEESVYGEAGNAFARRRMLNDALANLNAALELQPSSPFGHYLTGVVYYLTGFYETAEEHLQRAAKSGVEMAFARLALANVYIRMKEWENVVLQLDAYLEENPFAANRSWVKEVRMEAADKLKSPRQ
jgi:tetratricopeptide (TPR) repeat protein